MRLRSILVLAPLVLAACGDKSSDDGARAASGEVLEGTISDEMLPVDTVRSQPPLADPAAAARATASATRTTAAAPALGGAAEGEEDAAEVPAGGDATPAAEPTPEAED